MGQQASLIKFYLEAKMQQVEISFESSGETVNERAQASILRIMVQGTDMGGAIECKNCDKGSIANNR